MRGVGGFAEAQRAIDNLEGLKLRCYIGTWKTRWQAWNSEAWRWVLYRPFGKRSALFTIASNASFHTVGSTHLGSCPACYVYTHSATKKVGSTHLIKSCNFSTFARCWLCMGVNCPCKIALLKFSLMVDCHCQG